MGCIAFSGFLSWLLYFYRPNTDIKKSIRFTLAGLRFVFLFLLTLLLLSPLVLMNSKQIEKPLIVFAQDNSASILYSTDSSFYANDYISKVKKISEKFDSKFDFRFITFDQSVHKNSTIDYSGNETNLSLLFDELKNTFAGRNVGAIILASDGIFNKGGNPYYIAEKMPMPIYSVVMGDTIKQTDLAISAVDYNKSTFYKNTFPVEILINAHNLSSQKSTITISNNQSTLFSKELNISSQRYTETVRFFIDANQKGLQKYHISLKPVEGEFTLKNNEFDFFVNVLDSRDKILITYQTLHPDIAAIKQALLSSDMYQVDVKQVNQIDKPLNEYRTIFAYQLPDEKNSSANLFNSAKQWSIPIVYVIGNQSLLPEFNQLNTGIQILQQNNMTNDAFPLLNQNFVLFSIPSDVKQYISELPPITVPFGKYNLSASAIPFLMQRIGNYNSSMPLVVFNDQMNSKNCVILGEGIWKWRLASYQMYNHHRFFDELITKIPQYLVSQSDNSNFRVKIRQIFNQNEPITALAELYNPSLELDNTPEVSFLITDQNGKEFPYSFSRVNKSYNIEIGAMPVGEYRWLAKTKLGEKAYEKRGAFVVQNVNFEALNITADFGLLRSLANIHGGKTIMAKNIESITDEIEKNENIKPVSYLSKSYTELSQSWIYIILLLLIGISEWFIRKYNGLF